MSIEDAVRDVYRNIKSNPDSLSYLSGPVQILDVFRNSDALPNLDLIANAGFTCKQLFTFY